MALEPITRQEQIISGKDLQPITRMEMFLKEYGGGGSSGGAQSDWNQNDPTKPDYVKNRPFYEDGEIHKIDPKYLPDPDAYDAVLMEYQVNANIETATMTLLSGSYDNIMQKLKNEEIPRVKCFVKQVFDGDDGGSVNRIEYALVERWESTDGEEKLMVGGNLDWVMSPDGTFTLL